MRLECALAKLKQSVLSVILFLCIGSTLLFIQSNAHVCLNSCPSTELFVWRKPVRCCILVILLEGYGVKFPLSLKTLLYSLPTLQEIQHMVRVTSPVRDVDVLADLISDRFTYCGL